MAYIGLHDHWTAADIVALCIAGSYGCMQVYVSAVMPGATLYCTVRHVLSLLTADISDLFSCLTLTLTVVALCHLFHIME